MQYNWLDEFLLALPGTQKDFKAEWNATRYQVGGKMYVMVGGDKDANPIITLKLEPERGQFMRQQYPEIIPGYYMNKDHWNSIYFSGHVPDDELRSMLHLSYNIVLHSLPKKKQAEITST